MKSSLKTLITLAAMLMLIFSLCAVAEDTLHLPKDLKVIKANTFYGGTSIDKVVVPEGVTEIQSKAFANSTLKKITLPDSITFIADDAFEGCSQFTYACSEGSYAHNWGLTHGYILLDAPENIAVSVKKDKALSISWNPVKYAVGYYILSDGEIAGKTVGGNQCTYALENLASNKEYQISVQAYVDKYNGGEIPGKASDSVTCRTAPELTVTASVSNNTIIIGNPIDISVQAAGTYGSYTYRYTFKKGSETVFASGECTSTQYTYTPSSVGTYSIIVSVNDSLGRTSSYHIDDINVIAPELVVSNAKADKSFAMVGESITILAESNRDSSTLTYYANVYCGDIKVDSIIGMGRLLFVPDTVGIYSFSLTITDEYGQTSHIYLDSELTVVPYWKISGISVNTNSAAVGESITFTVANQGDMENVNLTYTIYRDSKAYRQLADTTKTEYSFTVNDEGQYYCECTAADAFNNEISVQSEKVTVERKTIVNPVYSTATHSGTLDADELNELSSKHVRITKDTITITWDKLSTDSYYELEIRGSSKSVGVIVFDENYTKNSYTIPASSLVQGCEYDVTIYRYNKSGKCTDDLEFEFVVIGGESLKLEESFKIIAPAKYAGVNYDDVVIQWKKMNYASTITVTLEYNCGAGKHNITSVSVDPAASSYTIPKDILHNQKIHKVKVQVKDAFGYSDSDSREFYVGCTGTEDLVDINPPILTSSYLWDLPARDQTPTYPVYEPIRISWEEMPAAEWFSLHLTNYNTKEELIFDKITTNHYTVQPTKLISGALYKVQVYAHHTEDCFKKSDIWKLRAPYKGNLLLDPPTVTSPDLSMDKKDPTIFVLQDLVISWEAVSAAKTYDVELYCVDDECTDYEVTGLTKLTTTIPKGDIFTNQLYYLSVTANDANGNHTYQGYYLKMIPSTITKPVLVSPALSTDSDNVSICADKNMQLMWGAVDGAVEYRVQLHELYGSRWEILVDAEGVKETTYTIPATELYDGGLFRIRIKAIDKYGNGLYSEMYYFQVGSSKFIELTLTDWTYDYTGGNKSFSIITSQNWTATVSDSWITIDKTSGKITDRVSVTVKENTGDFPRSGSVTFTNAAGGRAVFSIVQAGNGSANAGALKITTPEQGDTLDYAKFRANWNYKVEHAYFTVNLLDVTTGKTVYSLQHILFYADIPQSALTYGHIYQLTVAAYNAQYKKISESSVVFKVESLNSGTNDDDDVIEEPDIPEGATEIIYTGIKDGATIVKDDFTVSWQNVIGADHYYVAMRDLTLYPDGTPEDNVKKIIDQKTDLLTTNIHAGQLVEGHSYRLWIAAHKNGVDSPISGKNIYFSVKAADDAPEITDTNIPTATLTVASNQITLGDSIALSGKVLANGGILNQVRVTIQDAQTGKFCDYAIYDLEAIGSFGSYDTFDLSNVPSIPTNTTVHESGSTAARPGSESIALITIGNKYNIVIYGRNNGSDTMLVLASETVELRKEAFMTVVDSSGKNLNGTKGEIVFDYQGNCISGSINLTLRTNEDAYTMWTSHDDLSIDFVSAENGASNEKYISYKMRIKTNHYTTDRTIEIRAYNTWSVTGTASEIKWATFTVVQQGNPNVPVIQSAAIIDGDKRYDTSNGMQLVVGDHNYQNGYTLDIQSNTGTDVTWTVYTDDTSIAKAYRKDGLVYIHAKATGIAKLYISNIYVQEEKIEYLPDYAVVYSICTIKIVSPYNAIIAVSPSLDTITEANVVPGGDKKKVLGHDTRYRTNDYLSMNKLFSSLRFDNKTSVNQVDQIYSMNYTDGNRMWNEFEEACAILSDRTSSKSVTFVYILCHGNADLIAFGTDISKHVTFETLKSTLDEINGKIVMLIGSCQSGSTITETVRIPQGLFKKDLILYEDNGIFAIQNKYYVLTATSAEETSSSGTKYIYDESQKKWIVDEKNCWDRFTTAICTSVGWNNTNAVSPPSSAITVTLSDVYNKVCQYIQSIGLKQTTQVFPDNSNQIIFQRVK